MPYSCRRILQFVLGGFLLVLASCSTVSEQKLSFIPRQTTFATDRVVLESWGDANGELYVDVRINGAGPFSLLVDTGCDCMVLAQHVADAAGLKPLPGITMTMVNAAGINAPAKAVWIERLECGGLKLEGFAAAVHDEAAFAELNVLSGRRFEGAVGMQTLNDVVLEMDLPGRQVTVVRPGAKQYPADRAVGYREIVPMVNVNAGGRKVAMEIDTGSNGGLAVPKLDDVPLVYPKIKSIGGGAVFGKTSGKRGETGQLAGEARLGPVTWVNPPLSGMAHETSTGRLGIAALDQWKLAIDQHEHRIYFLGGDLKRAWAEEKPPDQRFELGFFSEIEGNALRLIEVDAGGAADLAGLRAGDLLLTMNGAPAATFTSGDYRSKLRVRRDNTEFETTMVMAPDYSPRQTVLTADRVTLPTSTVRGVFTVEARINGAGPFRFIVSTGDVALRVGQHVAEAAGLKPMADWKTRPDGSAPNVVWVERFESGGLELKGMAALLATPASFASARLLFGQIDGFLGMDALKDVNLEMDFPGKQVSAVRPGSQTYDAERAVAYRGTMPQVNLELPGRSQMVLINTASNRGFELPLLDETPLLGAKTKLDEISFQSTGTRGERGQIKGEVHAGPITWVRPPVTERKAARIGATALGAWKLVVDQQAHKLYFLDGGLRRTANVVPPTDPRFKAGYFAKLDGPTLRLAEVDAGAAFDRAGLRVGDVILNVDGKPARDYVREGGFFTARTNPRPKLRVQRNGAEFDVQLALAPGEAPE